MKTSTATEQIPDSNSRFSLLAIDDRNVRDNRSQRKKKKLAKSSVAETSIGKNASVDFQEIYRDLLDGKKCESAEDLKISPPEICTNSSQMRNDSAFNASGEDIFTSQDKEYLLLLEEIQNSCQKLEEDTRFPHVCPSKAKSPNFLNQKHCNGNFSQHKAGVTNEGRLVGYFCSNTVFNLSRKVLTEIEIKVLEKGLDFVPIQNKINEPERRSDFQEFSRRMRTKWHFRNEPTPFYSESPAFRPKSTWKPPLGHPNIEAFLSQLEKESFTLSEKPLRYSNVNKEEWQAVRSLANDRNIVIKKAGKGSCVV